jgi:hypothetical protein
MQVHPHSPTPPLTSSFSTLSRHTNSHSYVTTTNNHHHHIHHHHNTMQVLIKKLDGQKQQFDLEPSQSIADVKEMLAEKCGIFKEMIRLIFKGQPMTDEKSLQDHNVQAGEIIHMIMQMRG